MRAQHGEQIYDVTTKCAILSLSLLAHLFILLYYINTLLSLSCHEVGANKKKEEEEEEENKLCGTACSFN
jgi:hypothetical protein